jgi:hypothetical protein
MASRDYLKHTVNDTFITNSSIGDELFRPTEDRLYKRIAVAGTSVQWVEIPHIAEDGDLDLGGQIIVDTLTGTISVYYSGTNTVAAQITGTGIISDRAGDVRDIVNNDKTAQYTLAATDNGELINITTGGVILPANVFSAGNNITIYNNSASSQTITATAVTCYLAGTATTGNRTLSQRGIATIVCVAANTFVISGSGLS